MKIKVEIDIDERDLDAVAFALGLVVGQGRCRSLTQRDAARLALEERMRLEGRFVVTASNEMFTMWKEIHHGT